MPAEPRRRRPLRHRRLPRAGRRRRRYGLRRHGALLAAAALALAGLLLSQHFDPGALAGDGGTPASVGVHPNLARPAPPAGAPLTGASTPAPGHPARPAPHPILPGAGWPVSWLRLSPGRPRPAPASFLGLSTEYWTMPRYSRERRLFARVINLLRLPGQPITLRIGGDSADMAWWDPHRRRAPGWAYAVTPRWLAQTARLVADSHLRVMLDLNLVDRAPAREAQWARAFIARLPRRSVQAIEIGNEPDLYPVQGGMGELSTAAQARLARYFGWAVDYTPAAYDAQFAAYAAALRQAGVTAPLAGPAISNPASIGWLTSLLGQRSGRLAFVTAHRYPLSACETDRAASDYPTLRRLLAPGAWRGLAQGVKPDVLLSHRAGLPFHLTEFNSVTCGGTRALSRTFATALWSANALFALLRVGVDGVDVHVRTHAYNAPFMVSRHGLRAEPMLYGLVLFERMLRGPARLLPAQLHAGPRTRLSAWVVRAGQALRVLLVNTGRRGTDIRLHLPAGGRGGRASVQRLLAPSLTATRHVTLAGQSIGRGGHWRGRFTVQTVTAGAHGYVVAVPAGSAAMLTVQAPARRR